ncbi:MAG TPA: hypothetical protein PKI94_05405 [Candidatus Gastranaerophilaceae bacterium]|nr:hypothetical protein [Candidatus Gastranaerophilaceae bacterium]
MKINNVSFTGGILIRGTQKQHEEITKMLKDVFKKDDSLLSLPQSIGKKSVVLYAIQDTALKVKRYLPFDYQKYDAVMINPKNFGVKKLVRSAQTVLEAMKNHTFDFFNLAIYK